MKQGNTPPDKPIGGMARSLARKATVAAAALAMFAPFVVSGTAAYAADTPIDVVVNGADVETAAKSVNGLTFKGFGVLSANSTSSLLMDYKAQHPEAYWEMIKVLFGGDNPVMNTVKIEMGNDQNTSTGPNAATMRSSTEYPNVKHEPGFQLAADALKVNPNVKVSILRWRSPAWVKGNDDVYKWYKNTILAAYREYGFMVDSVNPHINESGPDLAWTKDFANRVKTDSTGFDSKDENAGFKSDTERELFHKIRTVISDEVSTGSFGDDMLSDEALRNAVDIAGYHYNTADQGNNFKTLADQYDKEVWNSEAQASFSVTGDRPNNTMNTGSGEGDGTNNGQNNGTSGTGIGGINSALEMANTYVKGFTSSRRTNFIYQPAISAFYDGFQYSSKEVITMHDPWSGTINWDGAFAVLEQVSRFAKTGYDSNNNASIWRGIPNASRSDITDGNPPGRGSAANSSRGGATSYMTLAAPDKSDFSTVIVNDSQYTKTYRIKAQDMNLGDDKTMELWETRAADDGEAYDANYVKPISELQPDADGYYEFQVKPWSIVTATTLDDAVNDCGIITARDGKGSQMPSNKEYVDGNDYAVLDTDESGKDNGKTDDETLYADDFEYKGYGNVQTIDTNGNLVDSGESYLDSRGGDTGATARYTNDTNGAFEIVKNADGNHVMRQQVGPGMAYGSWNGGAWNGGDPVTTLGDYRWANYKVSVNVLFEADAGNATVGARQWGNSSNGKDDSPAQLRVKPDGSWDFMRFGAVLQSGKATNFKTGANQWNNIAVQVLGDVYTAYINGVEVATYTDPQPQATGRVQLGSTFNFVQFDNLKVERIAGATPYYTDLIDNMHQRSWADGSALLTYNEKWQHLNGQGMYVYKRSISNSTGKGATLTYTFNGTGIDLLGANNGKAKLNVTVDGTKIALNAATIAADNGKPTTYELRGLKNGTHTVTFETADGNAISIDAVGVVKATAAGQLDVSPLQTAVDSYANLTADDWNPDTWAVFKANLDAANEALADPAAYGLDTEGVQALVARLDAASKGLVDKNISPDVKQLGLVAAAAKGAGLPKTVTIDGKDVSVTWDASAAQSVSNAGDYTQATITGLTDDKIDGTYRYRVTASVEVLPSLNIEYFIDSGVTGDAGSPEYNAVKAAIPSLRNAVADQKAGDWGYGNGVTVKTNTNANDKYNTGLYQTGKELTYTLPLEAGSYNLAAGFTEWWTGENRPMKLQATWTENGQDKTVDGSELASLGTAGKTSTGNVSFTLAEDATVTFKVLSNGGKDPVISWLAVEKQPTNIGVVAGTVGQDLPKTVSYNGADVTVTWNAASVAAFKAAEAYDTLTLSGQATVNGKAQTIEATVEVIPDGLVYYIDSGTSTASPQYTAVKNAVTLENDKVDQVSSADDQWGYVNDGINVKGGTDINDKNSTGLWAGADKDIVYRLPLKAGKYTLTAGFNDWWPRDRNLYQTVSAGDNELAKGSIPLSANSSTYTGGFDFTLTADATVTYRVTKQGAGSNDPVISWLAVAKQAADTTTTANKAVARQSVAKAQSQETKVAAQQTAAPALVDVTQPAEAAAEASATPTAAPKAAAKAAAAAGQCVVKFDANGGTLAGDATATVTKGDKLAKPADPTYDGYDFTGWTTDKEGKNAYSFDAPVTGDLTLYAQWKAKAGAGDTTAPVISGADDVTVTVGDVFDAKAGVTASDNVDGNLTGKITIEGADKVDTSKPGAYKVTYRVSDAAGNETTKERTVTVVAKTTVDRSKLQAKVDEVTADMGNLKADDYTYTSWDNLSKQLDAAKQVLADQDATQQQVDDALKSLTDARAGLVQRPSTGGGTTVITKKQATIAGVAAADAWFDGQSHAGYTGTPSSEFKGTYEITYTGAGTTTYGPSKTAPTAAGTYRVTISVPSSDSTWYGSLALEFAIRSGSTVVNRFYSAGSNRHMWTASAAESGALPGMGWNAEGAGFTMDEHAGVPVYRLYDPAGNQHLWTTSTEERDHLLGVGWNDEGIAFYENPTAKIDVYRLYDPYTGEHLWTTSLLERDSLVASGEWTYEGIAFKALS
ncbi:Listeria-Bacteroides repeat domain [Bifidobacterium sp. DSM 109958]|uniref:galactosylceramidase n=1 Tax=Bifidobacterium moraviense TaxID=2675323 RepID=A0A7Y0F2V8_9BIFI|nr:InlB B-repeat-containing protein [Bifidobacterium sp. DSM 109958]NMN01040.1 Listeria-Bacteroides repeat domain [Bifidobacterium sp. DSM 109958]